MTETLKRVKRKLKLWPTLAVRIELFPWHWIITPWGYVHFTGGLTFMLEWLGISIHFGCTVTPLAARKLKDAA